jgi:hypothetical protein
MEQEALLVLMCNDCPLGIYTTQQKADEAAEAHCQDFFGHRASELAKLNINPRQYYRTYPFVLDSKARF